MSSFLIDFQGSRGHESACTLDLGREFHGSRYSVYENHDDGSRSCVFHPHPKQVLYFDAEQAYVLFGGARGPGKTEAIIWDAIFKAYLVPGSRQIIFRRTMGELKATIIDRVKSLPEGLRGRCIGEMSFERVEFPNGSAIRFGSAANLKAVRKTLSGEFLCAHFDEWSEWPYSEWKFIAGSVRWTESLNVLGNPIIAQVKGATNPGGYGGDVLNHLFGCDIEKSVPIGEDPESYSPEEYLFIQTFIDDNPAYAANTAAGRAYRKMLASQPRRIRDAWLFGKWSGFEGQYFDNYEYLNIAISHDAIVRAMAKQHWQPIFLGLDWGKVHHAYVSWNTFIDLKLKSGHAKTFPVTFRELLIKGISEPALAQEVADQTPENEKKRVDKIYASPDLGTDRLSRGHRMSDVFIANGMPRMTAAYSDRANGWTLMYSLLGDRDEQENLILNELEDGSTVCNWLIDDELEYVFEALPWALASKQAGHDGDIEKEGDSPMLDVLDGTRYALASRIRPEEKPKEEILKEKLKDLPVVGSSRYIAHMKAKVESEKTSAPFYTSSRRFKPRRH
jgi:phage terminase large subunit